jgi:glycine betaine/proline transport system substrate-binding protein
MRVDFLKKAILAAALGAVTVLPAQAAGKVVIGEPAWPSAEVTAYILAMVLQDKFAAETELKQRGTLTILNEVNEDTIQIHPEVWLPNLAAALERMGGDGSNVTLSPIGVDASQNICTTKATAEQTGIAAVSDLADPEMAAKFDSDGDGMGEMWIGAPTWSSTVIEKVRARSYGYDKTMSLLEIPEEVAMVAVDAAAATDGPIVFYCYEPHHVFKLHDIVKLSEPPYDPDRWNIVNSAEDSHWLANSRAETAWDRSHFHIAYSGTVKTEMPEIAGFLDRVAFAPDDIVEMSYAVEVDRMPPEEVAKKWVEQNADRIEEWMK